MTVKFFVNCRLLLCSLNEIITSFNTNELFTFVFQPRSAISLLTNKLQVSSRCSVELSPRGELNDNLRESVEVSLLRSDDSAESAERREQRAGCVVL